MASNAPDEAHVSAGPQVKGQAMERDPVCGMQVDPKSAAGSAEYAGKTHYFCSAGCLSQFEMGPAKFAK